MAIIQWIFGAFLERLADRIVSEVSLRLRIQLEKQQAVEAIGKEAQELMGELDNANSEQERKAILRKLSVFSDLARLRMRNAEATSKDN